MKELALELTLRNNRLKQRREEKGWSRAEVARQAGLSPVVYGRFEALKASPLSKRTDQVWKPGVLKLAAFWGVEPVELFPMALASIERPTGEVKLDVRHALALTGEGSATLAESPDTLYEQLEACEEVRELVQYLPERERYVIERWYGLAEDDCDTWGEIAAKLGLSRERVRQTGWRAVDRLRAVCSVPEPERRRAILLRSRNRPPYYTEKLAGEAD